MDDMSVRRCATLEDVSPVPSTSTKPVTAVLGSGTSSVGRANPSPTISHVKEPANEISTVVIMSVTVHVTPGHVTHVSSAPPLSLTVPAVGVVWRSWGRVGCVPRALIRCQRVAGCVGKSLPVDQPTSVILVPSCVTKAAVNRAVTT